MARIRSRAKIKSNVFSFHVCCGGRRVSVVRGWADLGFLLGRCSPSRLRCRRARTGSLAAPCVSSSVWVLFPPRSIGEYLPFRLRGGNINSQYLAARVSYITTSTTVEPPRGGPQWAMRTSAEGYMSAISIDQMPETWVSTLDTDNPPSTARAGVRGGTHQFRNPGPGSCGDCSQSARGSASSRAGRSTWRGTCRCGPAPGRPWACHILPWLSIHPSIRPSVRPPSCLPSGHNHHIMTSLSFHHCGKEQDDIPSFPYTAYTRPSSTLPLRTDDVMDVNELPELATSAPWVVPVPGQQQEQRSRPGPSQHANILLSLSHPLPSWRHHAWLRGHTETGRQDTKRDTHAHTSSSTSSSHRWCSQEGRWPEELVCQLTASWDIRCDNRHTSSGWMISACGSAIVAALRVALSHNTLSPLFSLFLCPCRY